jgi:hypothetical protein
LKNLWKNKKLCCVELEDFFFVGENLTAFFFTYFYDSIIDSLKHWKCSPAIFQTKMKYKKSL